MMVPPRTHVVIHHLRTDLTLDEAEQALALGADGVFLISHDNQDAALPALAATLADRWRHAATQRGGRPVVGLNLLKSTPLAALASALDAEANALWVSAPGVNSAGVTPEGHLFAQALSEARRARAPGLQIFGCVAFKHQPHEPEPAAAAVAAAALGLLPTTSGSATGHAPDLAKIEAMSRAVGGSLAIASGMTPANVDRFGPWASDILVSTGVSRDAHRLDPALLKAFLAATGCPAEHPTDHS